MMNTIIKELERVAIEIVEIKRGDIFYIDIPKDEDDPHKQIGRRPCVIVSNDKNNKFCSRVQYIPLTSQDKKYIPTHMRLTSTECLPKDSIALCEGLDGINKRFLISKIGKVSEADMIKIEMGMDLQVHPNRRFEVALNRPSQLRATA